MSATTSPVLATGNSSAAATMIITVLKAITLTNLVNASYSIRYHHGGVVEQLAIAVVVLWTWSSALLFLELVMTALTAHDKRGAVGVNIIVIVVAALNLTVVAVDTVRSNQLKLSGNKV
jgi:hypothetical protein